MNVYEALMNEFSISECLKILANISSYNRIQGSIELEEAADYIAKILNDNGLNTKIYSYPYKKKYGLMEALIGWNVKSAELSMVKPKERILHTINEAKTLVVAHSPGGEIEAPVIYIGKGEDDKDYENKNIEGKIILSYGNPYFVYKKALKKKVAGIIFYKKEAPENAIPYSGLFLDIEEANEANAIALNISKRNANMILNMLEKNEEVILRAKVDIEYRDNPQIKIIETGIGDDEEEIDLVAHYCHPAGTINDNASGSAGLIELAIAMKRALDKGKIEKPLRKICFLWYPEYYGTIAFLSNLKRKIIAAINLDMIGEKQEITGSTLMLVRAPYFKTSFVEAILYHEIEKVFSKIKSFSGLSNALSIKFSIVDYEAGSDHDIYLDFGIPAYMLNQWPDKFYHSSEDTIDKIDPYVLKEIAIASGVAAYKSASIENFPEMKKYVYHYFMSLLHKKLGESMVNKLNRIYEIREKEFYKEFFLIINKIDKESGEKLKQFYKIENKEEKKKYIRKFIGPLNLKWFIKNIGEEKIAWLKEIIDKEKYYSTILFHALPMLLDKPISFEDIINKLEAEFGIEIEKEKVISLLKLLIECDLIIEIS
ncbi:MAG: DUF4910 domain-containing protein [Nitrososphaerota archaeon]